MRPAAVLAPAFSAASDMPQFRARTVEDDETDSLEGDRVAMSVLRRPTRGARDERGTRKQTWGQSRATGRAQEKRPRCPCPARLARRRTGLPR